MKIHPGAKGLGLKDFTVTSVPEQEITVNFDRLTKKVTICSCWPNRTITMSRKYGYPHKVDRSYGKICSAYWTFPMDSVRLHKIRKRGPTQPHNIDS